MKKYHKDGQHHGGSTVTPINPVGVSDPKKIPRKAVVRNEPLSLPSDPPHPTPAPVLFEILQKKSKKSKARASTKSNDRTMDSIPSPDFRDPKTPETNSIKNTAVDSSFYPEGVDIPIVPTDPVTPPTSPDVKPPVSSDTLSPLEMAVISERSEGDHSGSIFDPEQHRYIPTQPVYSDPDDGSENKIILSLTVFLVVIVMVMSLWFFLIR